MDTYFYEILDIFPSFKVGQTNVENFHFCWLCQNQNFKLDLATHLWDKHGFLFYEIWSYFGPLSKLVKPRLKTCTFFKFLEIEFWKWISVLLQLILPHMVDHTFMAFPVPPQTLWTPWTIFVPLMFPRLSLKTCIICYTQPLNLFSRIYVDLTLKPM